MRTHVKIVATRDSVERARAIAPRSCASCAERVTSKLVLVWARAVERRRLGTALSRPRGARHPAPPLKVRARCDRSQRSQSRSNLPAPRPAGLRPRRPMNRFSRLANTYRHPILGYSKWPAQSQHPFPYGREYGRYVQPAASVVTTASGPGCLPDDRCYRVRF